MRRVARLHECDVVDVGDLGAADALVDPAHDVAEDGLAVVVEFFALLLGGPVGVLGEGNGEDVVHGGAALALELVLDREDVDLVVVGGVQGGSGG